MASQEHDRVKGASISTPPEKQLYVICDNYATHKHPKVRRWLAPTRASRTFTPTSASWLKRCVRASAACQSFAAEKSWRIDSQPEKDLASCVLQLLTFFA